PHLAAPGKQNRYLIYSNDQVRSRSGLSRVSVAHELSGLGSTRVVRFSASGWRRIDEPDDVATGPQDAEVSRRIEPVGEQGAVGYGGSGDSRVLRATVPALSGTL